MAAEIAAEQAATLLTRAEAVDARCKFLTAPLHDELSDYGARAELAAATQVSAKAARNAVARGKAQAGKAQCDEATGAEITATLFAAREAVSTADSTKRVKTSAANPGNATAKEPKAGKSKQSGASAPRDKVKSVEVVTGEGGGSLSRYARLVGFYFIERKCRHLSPGQDIRYWRSIGRLHRATVAANGAAAVAALMQRAERNANAVPCGYESLFLVQSGFARTVRR